VSESKNTTPRKRIKKEDVDNDSDAKENKSRNKEKKPKGKESVKTDAAHDKSSKVGHHISHAFPRGIC
jgi:hypothetical protein